MDSLGVGDKSLRFGFHWHCCRQTHAHSDTFAANGHDTVWLLQLLTISTYRLTWNLLRHLEWKYFICTLYSMVFDFLNDKEKTETWIKGWKAVTATHYHRLHRLCNGCINGSLKIGSFFIYKSHRSGNSSKFIRKFRKKWKNELNFRRYASSFLWYLLPNLIKEIFNENYEIYDFL